MIVKTSELTGAEIVSGPHNYQEVKNKPGVYRMLNLRPSSAVVVVTNDLHILHVNDGWIVDFNDMERGLEELKFWLTNHEIPDEIIKKE